MTEQKDLRTVISLAIKLGLPFPPYGLPRLFRRLPQCLLPANLIQAQRDDFGAHTYERVDAKGIFHTHWE